MVAIPGFAVGLLGLLAVAVAFGLIQLTRYWLRPLLQAFATVLRVIPLVGGFLSSQVMRFERIVDGWLASAALHTERLMVGYFHGLVTLFSRLGEQIAGLALDAYHAVLRTARVVVPRLLRALETRLLRLVRAGAARVAQLGRFIGQQAAALGHRIATIERTVQAAIFRALRTAEQFALDRIRGAIGGILDGVHFLERAVKAIEYRIGQAEHAIYRAVWPELRRLADDLRPDRLYARLLLHIWSIVPRDVRLFFEWAWHWLHAGLEFLRALVLGGWPAPIHHEAGKSAATRLYSDRKRWAQSIRDEHGKH